MYISIEQAMDVYNELIDAKNGVNNFGGTVAEIYVYKVMPNSPTYDMNITGKYFDEENRMLERKAAEDFHSLCHIFSKKHEVSITIDSINIHEWISKVRTGEIRFFYRVHVEVLKLFPKKDV